MRPLASIVVLIAMVVPAAADRPVTEDERAKLQAAVEAQGCRGGDMEWDDEDKEFEVEGAVCQDGKKYEFKFDAEFKFVEKEEDS